MIKLIVGLANPGSKYATTRHNAGAWYVELLAERNQQQLKKEKKFYGRTGWLTFSHQNVCLLVPTTFMNLSGKAVAALATFYHIAPTDILIAHDELDLLPGSVRLKLGGGHGGHKGLKNIIDQLGNNQQFQRLRIGIGHPGNKNHVSDFVLSKPPTEEQQLIYDAINKAIHCTDILVTKNIVKTMNFLHTHCLN